MTTARKPRNGRLRKTAVQNAEAVARALDNQAAVGRDAAAYDAVIAARRLKPPPLPKNHTPEIGAGARALAKDIRTGVIRPRRAYVGPRT